MPIFRYMSDEIKAIDQTTFSELKIKERSDLQRLLRDQIEIVAPGTIVIAEEFRDWDESNRRIDLLAIDRDANVVVIELKRTEDGGHMELQAIRYAAMVSNLTFKQAVDIFTRYLADRKDSRNAEETLLEFLRWPEPLEDEFCKECRIVLISAEFSKELTTSVLWLYSRGIDVTCVRIKPYGTIDEVFLDVQQVIPLPEAEDYQIKVREKKQAEINSRKAKISEPWNEKDFYVSLGEWKGANWEDCCTYGFVTGSGGSWYTRTLDHLFVGARVFVNIPKCGFVGVGRVKETNQTVDQFMVKYNDGTRPILEVPLVATEMGKNIGDRDQCSNLVRVEWLKSVPREEAFWEKGLFASQHTACKLRSAHTIARVCEKFGIAQELGDAN